jgi:hypothetical protein
MEHVMVVMLTSLFQSLIAIFLQRLAVVPVVVAVAAVAVVPVVAAVAAVPVVAAVAAVVDVL